LPDDNDDQGDSKPKAKSGGGGGQNKNNNDKKSILDSQKPPMCYVCATRNHTENKCHKKKKAHQEAKYQVKSNDARGDRVSPGKHWNPPGASTNFMKQIQRGRRLP
jgi:hypothetical protein